MSVMMNPILPVPGPEKMLHNLNRIKPDSREDNSFAGHLDRRLNEKTTNRDKLGVAPRQEAKPRISDEKRIPANDEIEPDDFSEASLLGQFMQELLAVAEEKTGVPGEWNIAVPDMEALKQLAADAGMNGIEINGFLQQLTEVDKKINLPELFSTLEQYFDDFEAAPAIVVPETELPALETILGKMGVPQDMLEQLADQAVDRDGIFDLTKFIQGLEDVSIDSSLKIEDLTPVRLSSLEVEQLTNLLEQAGVTLEKQNELLPERFLNQVIGRVEGEEQPVVLTLDRLKNIIQQGLNEVRSNEPELNLPSFLNDLQKIVSQSGFENESVGWTPVVQETIDTVFQKLQELVDFAKIKVEKNNSLEEIALDSDFNKWLQAGEEKFADLGSRDADFAGELLHSRENEGIITGKTGLTRQDLTGLTLDKNSQQLISPEAVTKTATAPMPHRLHQQVIQQLSSGVMRGLKNQDHHLVLRLYPQDMGEVKVDLSVKHDQVSISFNMENHRVKEMLESHMEDFKDNMDRQGFVLEECSVSVGYQGDDNNSELWQRFAEAGQDMKRAGETLADISDDVLYRQAGDPARRGSENGISLMV